MEAWGQVDLGTQPQFLPSFALPHILRPTGKCLGNVSPSSLGTVSCQPTAPRSPCRTGKRPRARKRRKCHHVSHCVPSSELQGFLLVAASFPAPTAHSPSGCSPSPAGPPRSGHPPPPLSFASSGSFSLKPLNIFKFPNKFLQGLRFPESLKHNSCDYQSIHDPFSFTFLIHFFYSSKRHTQEPPNQDLRPDFAPSLHHPEFCFLFPHSGIS